MPRYKYLDLTPHVFVDLQATPEQQQDPVLSSHPGRVLQPGEEFEVDIEIRHGLVHKLDVPESDCTHCVGHLELLPKSIAVPTAPIPVQSPAVEPALD